MAMNTWAAGFSHSINAVIEQDICVPQDLSAMSKEELEALLKMLQKKYRPLQENLETTSQLLNKCLSVKTGTKPSEMEKALEFQIEVIRDQESAIAKEGMRVKDEITRRVFEQVHEQPVPGR